MISFCICQPCVPEKRSSLLDHPILRFSVSFSTKCGMFFIYRQCTPLDWLYGITDRSMSLWANWRGLYGITDRSMSLWANWCGLYGITDRSMSLWANWRGLYGITDRSISVDRDLYGPINIHEVFTFDS